MLKALASIARKLFVRLKNTYSPQRNLARGRRDFCFSYETAVQSFTPINVLPTSKRIKPRALGVLLCYNDADLLPEAIEYLLANNHDVIAWNHGSTDDTADVLDRYGKDLVETRFLPRDFDFYKLYETMSENLISNYVSKYDWISWPDQDEFLEAPSRQQSYYEFATDVFNSEYDWVQFHNLLYWFTSADDPTIASPVERIRRYSHFPDCSPRVRAWRSSATNIRWFNHNPLEGERWPEMGKLRHYQMRSHEHALQRIQKDRTGLQRGRTIAYYNLMNTWPERIIVEPNKLNYDDGTSELSVDPVFNWRYIYGTLEEQSLFADQHPASLAEVVAK